MQEVYQPFWWMPERVIEFSPGDIIEVKEPILIDSPVGRSKFGPEDYIPVGTRGVVSGGEPGPFWMGINLEGYTPRVIGWPCSADRHLRRIEAIS